MSSFAFSFSATPKDWPASAGVWTGSAEQLKKYNAPSPCKWNDACVYSKCCGFVHAGEEGTGLMYFPGRTVTGDDGKQFWEPACVRLIGSPRFYERRRLHLSWPAWCARVGLAAPVPLCDRAPVASVPAPVASVPAPVAVAPPPAVTQAFIQQQAQIQAQRQWYQQVAAWQAFFYQQQQAAIARLPAWRQPGLSVMMAKNAIGEQIYLLVKARMDESAAHRATLGLAHPSITPGKITGMILDAHTIDELERLLTDEAEFSRNLWQGVHVLAAYAAGQDTERAAAAADAEWSATATA